MSRRLHLFIATTAGPVRLQSIVPYPAPSREGSVAFASMAVVNGLGSASFSSRYREFVSLVVERRFRHRHFVVSVERDIHVGESWRLPVLLGHEARARADLHWGDDAPIAGDLVILATGEVTHRLELRAVEGIAAKFEQAREALATWLRAEVEVVVALPSANRGEVPAELLAELEDHGHLRLLDDDDYECLLGQIDALAVAAASPAEAEQEAHGDVGQQLAETSQHKAALDDDPATQPAPLARRSGFWGAAAVLGLLAALGLGFATYAPNNAPVGADSSANPDAAEGIAPESDRGQVRSHGGELRERWDSPVGADLSANVGAVEGVPPEPDRGQVRSHSEEVAGRWDGLAPEAADIRVVAEIARHFDACDQVLERQAAIEDGVVAPVAMARLCRLHLSAEEQALLAVLALEPLRLLALGQGAVEVPLPSIRRVDRHLAYVQIAAEDFGSEEVEARFEAWLAEAEDLPLQERSAGLRRAMADEGWQAQLWRHQLSAQ